MLLNGYHIVNRRLSVITIHIEKNRIYGFRWWKVFSFYLVSGVAKRFEISVVVETIDEDINELTEPKTVMDQSNQYGDVQLASVQT